MANAPTVHSTHNAKSAAASTKAAARKAGDSNWLEMLARLGYCSRGVIYSIIGVMAVLAAFGEGGGTTSSKGALTKVLEAPGGWLILAIIALGLVGYAAWQFCRSVLDADHQGDDGKAMAKRTGYFVSGIAHLLLAFWAGSLVYKLVAGEGAIAGSGGSGSSQSMVAWLMSQPFGQWLVGIVGLIVIGVGVNQFLKGYKKKYERHLKWSGEKKQKLTPVCQAGLYARAVVFAILGSFIVYAAYTTDPSQAGGLTDALAWLRQQAYGAILFGLTALGLAAFGVYNFIQAAYRRVDTPE